MWKIAGKDMMNPMTRSIHFAAWMVFLSCLHVLGAEYSGRVLDPDGKEVKGARVWLLQHDEKSKEIATASVLSNEQGNFKIVSSVETNKSYPDELVAGAKGWGISALTAGKNEPAEIRLKDEIAVTVPFVDEKGRPVRDLAVRIHQLSLAGGFRAGLIRPVATMGGIFAGKTDGNGEVTMKQMPRGGRLWLTTDDERFARLDLSASFQLSDEPAMRAEPIKLVAAASVMGRIVYEDGKPAAGMKVGAQGIHPTSGWGDGVSDANGFYVLRQMAAGAYNIALDLQGEPNKSWTARAHQGLKLEAGEEKRDLDFKLISGAVISGKVMAQDNGEPISGVDVMVYGPAHPKSGAWVQGFITSADGKYFLRVPPGEQYLYIGMSQPPDGFLMPKDKAQTLTLEDGQKLTVDFKFPRGPKLPIVRGKVVDENQDAVGGCTLTLYPGGRTVDHSAWPYPVEANADGTFEFPLRYPVTLVRARKNELATAAAVEVAGDKDANIVVKVQRGAMSGVSGTVVDTRGNLVAGAKISLTETYGGAGIGGETASSGVDGVFRINELWADGGYSVEVSARGMAQNRTNKLELKPGEILDVGEIVIKDLDSFISGTVLDADGKPVEGVTVSINGARETPIMQLKTGADGKFKIPAVKGDQMTLFVVYGPAAIATKRVSGGDEDIQMSPPVRRR
jgi:protocatechuate 3,4-dioxygenase beta subunit